MGRGGNSPHHASIPELFLDTGKVNENRALDTSKCLCEDAAAQGWWTPACIAAWPRSGRAHEFTISLCLPQPNALLLRLRPGRKSRNMNFITTHIRSGPGGKARRRQAARCGSGGPAGMPGVGAGVEGSQPPCTPS